MKLEVLLLLVGLLMFAVFSSMRGINRFRGVDAEHLFVLRNVGCLLAIIGLSILIFRTFQSFS